jgi:hypothetical protein
MMSRPLVAAGVVVLTDHWLDTALRAVLLAERRRSLDGLPPRADYGQLIEALSSALAATGHQPVTDRPEREQWVSTKQAARQLGCSERQARRVAARLGERVGGRWLIPAAALENEED